jgi:hypothetical protein
MQDLVVGLSKAGYGGANAMISKYLGDANFN